MFKKLSALKARQNLGQVMNEVSLKGDDYIIERAGKPLVAIVSIEKYQILQREREEALQALDKVWEKMKGVKPETIERTIIEAVNTARRL
jgi:prevent-host-death family protein